MSSDGQVRVDKSSEIEIELSVNISNNKKFSSSELNPGVVQG